MKAGFSIDGYVPDLLSGRNVRRLFSTRYTLRPPTEKSASNNEPSLEPINRKLLPSCRIMF